MLFSIIHTNFHLCCCSQHLFEDDLYGTLSGANAADEAKGPGVFLHAAANRASDGGGNMADAVYAEAEMGLMGDPFAGPVPATVSGGQGTLSTPQWGFGGAGFETETLLPPGVEDVRGSLAAAAAAAELVEDEGLDELEELFGEFDGPAPRGPRVVPSAATYEVLPTVGELSAVEIADMRQQVFDQQEPPEPLHQQSGGVGHGPMLDSGEKQGVE